MANIRIFIFDIKSCRLTDWETDKNSAAQYSRDERRNYIGIMELTKQKSGFTEQIFTLSITLNNYIAFKFRE